MAKKPKIGNKKPSEVKEKKKRVVKKVEKPDVGLPFVNGVKNPLLGNGRMKRALAVAIAMQSDDEELLCEAGRQAGIVQKSGMSGKGLKTGELSQNELSGRGYMVRFAKAKKAQYYEDQKEKVDACIDFAKALVKAIKGNKIEDARKTGMAEYEAKKGDLVKAETEAKKKKTKKKTGKKSSKSKKGGKPALKKGDKKGKAPAKEEDAA